ncbi:MAG TPA: 3-oxoacyl-[acyl-carrier-protein] synthase III C-terminal domain-containing protein [Candidatus Binataceae bacterium]|nr:3-oxoacyl-[acyl-carrier-protein] synthase III C-terminal domain-containing protein [Candidatus Binataceae bacterium]
MAGIVSYGSYVPYRRLKRAAIGQVLGIAAGKGERAVASFDEDSVSMAVEATRDALRGAPAANTQALFFATTTPPYGEKLHAAIIGAATLLPVEIRAADLTGSVRAGISSMLQASDAVKGGAKQAIAAMSDCRLAAPEGKGEQSNGDAAAAFVFGNENVIAEIEANASLTREVLDTWRAPGERFGHSWEERFSLTQTYGPALGNIIKTVLEKAKIAPGDLAKIVIDAPNPRAVDEVAKSLKLDPAKFADSFAPTVGQTGAAHVGLMLAAALSAAKPGDRILVVSVADGADAFVLKVMPAITSFKPARSVGRMIESKGDVTYGNYLKWREILPTEPPRRPDPERPAGPPMLRSEKWKYGFIGSKCTACGTPQLPPQLVCVKCQKRQMEPYSFADRTAKIATYAIDRLAYSLNPPTINVVIDFEGGGRFLGEMTDCEPEKVAIGDEVEMTFRRLFTAGGVHNYFWKARPKR